MRRNGMKNDQINEVIQKESKHIEQTAEEKEQQRQQMMLELKNRIKEEMARKEDLLKTKKRRRDRARERAREPVEGAPPPKYKVKEVVLSYKRENKMKKTANNFILYVYLFIIIK